MKRLLLPLALAATAALLWQSVTPARACSVFEDFDPVRESDLIVGGRITGWEIIQSATRSTDNAERLPADDPNYFGPYEPVRFQMTVEEVYKGSAANVIEIVAGNTLKIDHASGRNDWVGATGACGAFDSDPTGTYWVLGLTTDELGRYWPGRALVFYRGDDPPPDDADPLGDPIGLRMVGSLGSNHARIATNQDSSAVRTPTLPLVIAAVALPLVFVLAASFVFPARGSRP